MKYKFSWILALVWSTCFLAFLSGCGDKSAEDAPEDAVVSKTETTQSPGGAEGEGAGGNASQTGTMVDGQGGNTAGESRPGIFESGEDLPEPVIDFNTLDSFVETNSVVQTNQVVAGVPGQAGSPASTVKAGSGGMEDSSVSKPAPLQDANAGQTAAQDQILSNMDPDELPDLASLDADDSPEATPEQAPSATREAQTEEPEEVLPLVLLEETALPDAITFLAAQAGINFLFDPRVTQEQVAADGSVVPPKMVSIQFRDVTARAALNAVMANYGLEMIEDDKTGIARITIRDPAAPPPLITKIIQLKYSSPTNFVSILEPVLVDSRSRAVPSTRTSQVVIIATEPEHEEVAQLVENLDNPTPQVLIEAHIMETSSAPRSSKGIDWSSTLANQNVSFGNGVTSREFTRTTPGTTTSTTLPSGRTVTSTGGDVTSDSISSVLNPIAGIIGLSLSTGNGFDPNTAFLNADGLSVALSFLNTQLDGKVVATPRTVTLDNEPARLEVFRAFPIFTITPGSANSPAGAEITYTNMGTILNVTPRITANSNINLKVVPEVSNIDGQDRQIINGQENVANIYAIRRVETSVVVPTRHTLVMGGLISDSTSKDYSKVPFLGDIPGLGRLFRKESKTRDKSNLIIFVTPSIITETDFQTAAESTFLQTPKILEDAGDDWSKWDYAKPRDKKKPKEKDTPDQTAGEVLAEPETSHGEVYYAPPVPDPPRTLW